MDAVAECRQVTAPTLVMTGEPGLDHVLGSNEASAYTALIAGSRAAVLEGTGHLGLVTKPHRFASTVTRFVDELHLGAPGDPPTEGAHDAA
jgi:pimeloyl-ACP methyl ester carboxylesterase